MATETEKTAATKPAAAKSAAPKAAVKKSAASKTTTRKSPVRKAAAKTRQTEGKVALIFPVKLKQTAAMARTKIKDSADKAQGMVKTMVFAQMGVYGMVYDEITTRIESTRKDAPKRWSSLVKRGAKMQKDFEKSGGELKAKIKDISFRSGVEKVKDFRKKAA